MDFDVRSIYLLARDEIIQLAHRRAEAGEPMLHGFEPGSAQAVTFETAYQRRRIELDSVEA